MNRYKLVFSSVRNQTHIYTIYIVSLILSFTFFLTFINLSASMIDATKEYNTASSIYYAVIILIGIFFLILICYLINYVQTLLIGARSKELAVYRLVSFSTRELRKYLFIEQLVINTFSFIIALILSIILSVLFLNGFNESVAEMLSMTISFKFSSPMIGYELIMLVLISLIASITITQKIEKQELIDLLNTKLALPVEDKEKHVIVNAIFVFLTWVGLIYILFEQFGRLKFVTLGAILVIYIVSVFSIYIVLAKIIVKIIPSKVYYKDANSFTTSIIRRKLHTNAKSMAFVTILLTVCVFTIAFGIANNQFISFLSQKDDVVVNTNYESIYFTYNDVDYTLNYNRDYNSDLNFFDENNYTISEYSYNKFADKYNLSNVDLKQGEAIVISTSKNNLTAQQITDNDDAYPPFSVIQSHYVTSQESETITVVDDSYKPDATETLDQLYTELNENNVPVSARTYKKGDLDIYQDGEKSAGSSNVMSQSEANHLLKRLGISEQFDLETNKVGYMGSIPYTLDSNLVITHADKTDYPVTQFIVDDSLKVLEFGVFVIDDQLYDQFKTYTFQYMNVSFTSKYDLEFWKNLEATDFPGWIALKNEQNTALLLTNVILSGATVFIGLVILLLLITIIGVQVNIDSLETKQQFGNLRKIGYSSKQINQIINKITFIYFVIPLIIGILNIVVLNIVFARYLRQYTTVTLIRGAGTISSHYFVYIVVFVMLIYLLYCLLVNISYKRVINKQWK